MGWGRMLLLGNVGQQLDIGELQGEIEQMRRANDQAERLDQVQGRDIERLWRENQELKVYLAALVRLLVAKGILLPEESEKMVKAIED